MYNSIIKEYVPKEWCLNGVQLIRVKKKYQEFKDVDYMFYDEGYSLTSLYRHENLNKYGRFLLRQQKLLSESSQSFYTVTRYVAVPKDEVDDAIFCNLDERRCNFFVDFSISIHGADCDSGYDVAIFVVTIITDDPYDDIFIPDDTNDFYIKYCAYGNW